jgi:signal transduction histidine kinase
MFKKKNLKVRSKIAEGVPLTMIDKDKIKQVMFNLLLNAIEASPKGAQIEVGVEFNKKKNMLALNMKDRGKGVPKELQERVFDLFFTTKEGNSGIGLALSKKIVNDHNGSIRLEPRKNGGSVAVVELPVRSLNV